MIDPRLSLYGTTLADPNMLSPQALVQQPGAVGGIPQIPTGVVETTHEPSTERKIVGTETRESMGAMDTAFQSKLTATDQQAKTDIAREQAQAEMAQKKAEEAAKFEEQREKMRQVEEQRRAAEMATRAQALAEYEKTAKVTSLFDDMSPARKFLSAIAVGAGQWAASMGGGPNTAYQIFKDQEENHRKVQEDRIKAATQKVMNQTQSAQEARKYFESAMEDLDKRQLAKLKVMDLQLAAIEKAQPEAAAKAAAARAQIQIDYEKGKRDFVSGYDTTVKEVGKSTQQSSGKLTGGPDFSTRQAVVNAQETSRSMRELGDLVEKNPKAWAEFQKAFKAEQESIAWKEGAGKSMASTAQFFGAMPVALDQRLTSPEARKINAAIAPLITAKAREMDPVGALNQSAYDNAARSLNIMTAPPKEMKAKAFEYADRSERLAAGFAGQFAGTLQPQASAQPTGKVGSPNRVRGIPPAKQDAATTAADDYLGIISAIRSKAVKLTPQEDAEFKEAYEAQKKAANAGTVDEEAASYMRKLRQRKGI